ncbi:ATP-dependent DNA helicase PIF1 [Agrilus planipennis]|uniref:ATP-dependent DNA helicase PIF1 n=1 Tax=Agrilus planipennis TaxID=224129 RepID=A0A1W4XP84_AGRPL|nr:ATP-dependent DNA helicase PIF1 [Agrilus planipennis]
MNSNENLISCSINLEWQTPQGTTGRKIAYKSGHVRIIRNEFRKMFIEIGTGKSTASTKLEVKGIVVHNKFMNDGKASIKFPEERCTLFLSNAPPSALVGFLKTIFVKMTGEKNISNNNLSLRAQLLSNKPRSFEEISPVTNAEIDNAKEKLSRGTDTTPSPSSRKRKKSETNHDHKAPAAKKLYAPSPLPNQELTDEQKKVLDACLSGRNVFFTGSAGTGKSFLLKKIIAALPPDVTYPTASTGVAACHIGGTTLHQFAGIGSGEATLENCYDKASKPAAARVWRRCKHLIIDEISMIDGNFFEKIEAVARYIRKNDKPFGGIQLILCGDFFQLPPVVKKDANSKIPKVRFCFQTPVWKKCIQISYELTQVHRQNDMKFIDILNNIRVGNITSEISEKLLATSKQVIEQNGILATRLCSHTQDADSINQSKLSNLPGDSKVFEAEDSDKSMSYILDQQTTVPSTLVLKVGAQVMLMKNINIASGLVNGARGVVAGFREGLPVVKFRNNKDYVAKHERWMVKSIHGGTIIRKQIPLKLAWAFSIHKSQGLTLDCVEMSLSRVFEAGQAYVALSRAQSLETLRVLDMKSSQVYANPDVLNFYRRFKEQLDITEYIALGTKENKGKKVQKLKSNVWLNKKPLVCIS